MKLGLKSEELYFYLYESPMLLVYLLPLNLKLLLMIDYVHKVAFFRDFF